MQYCECCVGERERSGCRGGHGCGSSVSERQKESLTTDGFVVKVRGASKECYLACPAMRDVKAGDKKRFTSTIDGHLVVIKVC
jgi:hypothetical protein